MTVPGPARRPWYHAGVRLVVFTAHGGDPRVVYALLRLAAEADEHSPTRRPVNLALVIDRSSSMRGPRLAQAVRAVRRLLTRLDDRDRLAVVAFDGAAKVLVPPGPVNAENRARLDAELSRLRTGAGTNLAAGWKKGCELVASAFVREAYSRVILLTDGLPSVGIATRPSSRHGPGRSAAGSHDAMGSGRLDDGCSANRTAGQRGSTTGQRRVDPRGVRRSSRRVRDRARHVELRSSRERRHVCEVLLASHRPTPEGMVIESVRSPRGAAPGPARLTRSAGARGAWWQDLVRGGAPLT